MARYKLAYLHPAETDILGIVRFHAEQVGPASAREIYRSIQNKSTDIRRDIRTFIYLSSLG